MTALSPRSRAIRVAGLASASDVAALREWLASANHIAEHTASEQHELRHRFDAIEEDLSEGVNVGRSVVRLSRRLVRENVELRAELRDLRSALADVCGAISENDGARAAATAARLAEAVSSDRAAAQPGQPQVAASRVQLGRGEAWRAEVMRLDTTDSFGADLVVRPEDIPVSPGTVVELFVDGVIERYDDDRVRHELLPAWFELLAPGGRIQLSCVDVDAAVDAWHSGELGYDALRSAITGSIPSTPSRSGFTAATITKALSDVGFDDIAIESAIPHGGATTRLIATARRPADG